MSDAEWLLDLTFLTDVTENEPPAHTVTGQRQTHIWYVKAVAFMDNSFVDVDVCKTSGQMVELFCGDTVEMEILVIGQYI